MPQSLDRFLAGAKLLSDQAPTDGSSAAVSEEENIVGMLQRVLHPRLKSMLSESNLAVRQVRFERETDFVMLWGKCTHQLPAAQISCTSGQDICPYVIGETWQRLQTGTHR